MIATFMVCSPQQSQIFTQTDSWYFHNQHCRYLHRQIHDIFTTKISDIYTDRCRRNPPVNKLKDKPILKDLRVSLEDLHTGIHYISVNNTLEFVYVEVASHESLKPNKMLTLLSSFSLDVTMVTLMFTYYHGYVSVFISPRLR